MSLLGFYGESFLGCGDLITLKSLRSESSVSLSASSALSGFEQYDDDDL